MSIQVATVCDSCGCEHRAEWVADVRLPAGWATLHVPEPPVRCGWEDEEGCGGSDWIELPRSAGYECRGCQRRIGHKTWHARRAYAPRPSHTLCAGCTARALTASHHACLRCGRPVYDEHPGAACTACNASMMENDS